MTAGRSSEDLRRALADLTPAERWAVAAAAAEARDRRAETGDHRLARVYQALALAASEAEVDEREALAELRRALDGMS